MDALLWPVLAASLLGSPHCAAMCGGIACLTNSPGERSWRGPVAYHGARLTAYATLGFLAGSLGAAVDWLGGMTRIGRPAAVLAGAVLVAAGIRALLLAAGVRLPGGLGGRPLPVLSTVMKRLGRLTPTWRGVSLGLATGLLPCGWLYAFLATAASTGTGPRGAGTMAIFWLGSVPIFAAVGVTAQRALGPLRRHLPLVTGIVLVAVGLLTIRRADHVHPTVAVAPSGAHDHHAP